MIGLAGAFAVTSIVLIYLSRRRVGADGAEHTVIASVALSVLDLVTDCVFLDYVWSLQGFETLKLLLIVFLVAPCVLNFATVWYVVGGIEMSRKGFSDYFDSHRGAVSTVMVLSVISTKNLQLLHSRVLGLQMFHAPFAGRLAGFCELAA